ncbi:MAG: protein phosphatase 2C domain-containing protein [Acidobacteriota bacterium]|nr:protein phosphatase 2C domain-containing protein [Acidobacteriota bacterium]
MKETLQELIIETASITDRGLSEKRPVNEDSLLADAERRIFAVADGVGGAEAGEVASQTAVEILEEAFRQRQNGDDVEDLLEIALQRANTAIFQMSREQSHISMMATTIVALHLDGHRATIGHVGDSRLYRLSPDGQLHRETADHSMVEEEVRAGRMTPEQAATHPSRNVISRALGAEAAVEVDLKTIEVEDETLFLLCSDGITRHIDDAEIGALLKSEPSLAALCDEMKRRCFERGAEDNLTAVAVRIGQPAAVAAARDDEGERTLIFERAAVASTAPSRATAGAAAAEEIFRRPFDDAGISRSRIEVATNDNAAIANSMLPATPTHTPSGNFGRALGVLLLLIGVAAAAFYGGTQFPRFNQQLGLAPAATPTPTPISLATEASASRFDQVKREVDLAPAAMVSRLASESDNQPLASNDPEFLYLYGRALLLSGRHQDAMQALELAAQKIKERPATTPGRDPLAVETRIATAAAALRANNSDVTQRATQSLEEVIERPNAIGPSGAATPTPTPF